MMLLLAVFACLVASCIALLFLYTKKTTSLQVKNNASGRAEEHQAWSSPLIPGPHGHDHSADLAACGSLTAYVSHLHQVEYPQSTVVRFCRSPGDVIISCRDVNILQRVGLRLGARPEGLFQFLTSMLGDDNMQIYPTRDAIALRSVLRAPLNHRHLATAMSQMFQPTQVVHHHVGRWKAQAAAKSPAQQQIRVYAQKDLLVCAVRAGAAVVFGYDVEATGVVPDLQAFTDDFHHLVDLAVEGGIAPLSATALDKFSMYRARVDGALLDVVRHRRDTLAAAVAAQSNGDGDSPGGGDGGRGDGNGDILSALLVRPDPRTGQAFTDDKIVMLLKMCTNYTGAVAAAWVLHTLAKERTWLERVAAEVLSLETGENDQLHVDVVSAKSAPILDAVVSEVMRLYPTSPFAARLVDREKGVELFEGCTVPKGVTLFVPIRDLQFDPVLWPSPHTFDPTRFLGDESGASSGGSSSSSTTTTTGRCVAPPHALASMPFGFGMRACPGEKMAWLQIKVIVAEVIRAFDVRLSSVPAAPGPGSGYHEGAHASTRDSNVDGGGGGGAGRAGRDGGGGDRNGGGDHRGSVDASAGGGARAGVGGVEESEKFVLWAADDLILDLVLRT